MKSLLLSVMLIFATPTIACPIWVTEGCGPYIERQQDKFLLWADGEDEPVLKATFTEEDITWLDANVIIIDDILYATPTDQNDICD